MSRIMDYKDRTTCMLFGDGAGRDVDRTSAAKAKRTSASSTSSARSTARAAQYLRMPAGGSRIPASAETVAKRMHYVHQEGAQVFKYAVLKMQEVCLALLERNGLTPPIWIC